MIGTQINARGEWCTPIPLWQRAWKLYILDPSQSLPVYILYDKILRLALSGSSVDHSSKLSNLRGIVWTSWVGSQFMWHGDLQLVSEVWAVLWRNEPLTCGISLRVVSTGVILQYTKMGWKRKSEWPVCPALRDFPNIGLSVPKPGKITLFML